MAGKKPSSRGARGGGKGDKDRGAPPSRLYRAREDYSWTGVKTERYKACDGTWADVIRRVIVGGARGERAKFHFRYLEIAPGGRTTLERHRHEHVVVCVRGRGMCLAGEKEHEMGNLDVLYVAPDAPHQLWNPFDEPFGFFCIVDARRDRPRPIRQS
ncbi:MAG: hypothetical protein Kow0025_20470 [Thermodesulfovibrionales bacterium]